MSRIIVYFKDKDTNYINIEGTDIFERDTYLHIYNGNELVAVVLADAVKVAYKSVKGG